MDYSEEQTADFQKRAKEFIDEWKSAYDTIKEKHQCELVYGVVTVPSPSGVFGLGVQESIGDLKHKATVSPLNDEFVEKG